MNKITLYKAVRNNNLDDVISILSHGVDVDSVLSIIVPQIGYTALHFACLQNNEILVKLLIQVYHADVNAVAYDGTQPIQLASLHGDPSIADFLLASGANVNAGFPINSKEFLDSFDSVRWFDDFGGNITLLTYAILERKEELAKCFMNHGANIKDADNKTSLMHAIEKDDYKLSQWIVCKFQDHSELINAHDNNGLHAIHYLLHKTKYNNFRFDDKQLFLLKFQYQTLCKLIEAGVDVNETVKGDPDTLLLNMAAYRRCSMMVKKLLPLTDMTQSKALQNTRISNTDLHMFLRPWPESYNRIEPISWDTLEQQRKLTTQWIVQDLVNRRTFGLYVPEEEKKLMDQLLIEDHEIRNTVQDYENSYLRGHLKNNIFHLGDKIITFYEFAEIILNNRRVIGFLKNYGYHTIKLDLETYFDTQQNDLRSLLEFTVDRAWKRSFLLEKLKTLSQLMKYIPLPYELILEIIDYLDNDDLQRFINSFHCT